MFTLSKAFRFEAAHRLVGYPGKCANIHGHSWKGKVVVECDVLNEQSFGIDYADLKALISPLIDEFDHALLLLNRSDDDLLHICHRNKWKVHLFSANPTSEVIAKYLFDQWRPQINDRSKGIRLKKVVIKETCTSSCEYVGH